MLQIKKLKNIFFCVVAIFYFSSCQSTPDKSTLKNSSEIKKMAASDRINQAAIPEIDYQSIQRLLNLDKNTSQLGFEERAFNTCKVGFGFSAAENCLNKYFVVIHFKLMCRNSEGTVSNHLLEDDLVPVANQYLRWTIKNTSGELTTNSEGRGQVLLVATGSQRTERFRISSSKDFLLMRAGDIKRLIVPGNWCE